MKFPQYIKQLKVKYIKHLASNDYGKIDIRPKSITVTWRTARANGPTSMDSFDTSSSFDSYIRNWRGGVIEVSKEEYITYLVMNS